MWVTSYQKLTTKMKPQKTKKAQKRYIQKECLKYS